MKLKTNYFEQAVSIACVIITNPASLVEDAFVIYNIITTFVIILGLATVVSNIAMGVKLFAVFILLHVVAEIVFSIYMPNEPFARRSILVISSVVSIYFSVTLFAFTEAIQHAGMGDSDRPQVIQLEEQSHANTTLDDAVDDVFTVPMGDPATDISLPGYKEQASHENLHSYYFTGTRIPSGA